MLKSIIFRRANSPPVRPLSQRDIWESHIGRGDGAASLFLSGGEGLEEHTNRICLVTILPFAPESPGLPDEPGAVYQPTLRAEPIHHADESCSEVERVSLLSHRRKCSISAIGAGGMRGGHFEHFPLDIDSGHVSHWEM